MKFKGINTFQNEVNWLKCKIMKIKKQLNVHTTNNFILCSLSYEFNYILYYKENSNIH